MKAIPVTHSSVQQHALPHRKFSDLCRYLMCHWLCDFRLWQDADATALEETFDALVVDSHYGLQFAVQPKQK